MLTGFVTASVVPAAVGCRYGPFGDRCDYFCDLQGTEQCNLQESLCQPDYKRSAKFVRTGVSNGIEVNIFTWKDNMGRLNGASMESWKLLVWAIA